MAKVDTATRDHLEWLGYVQPKGLVVSAPALVRAGAVLAKNDTEGQRLLRSVTHEMTVPGLSEPALVATDFETFARTVLGWKFSPRGYAGTADRPIPDELVVHLHDHGETLAPDYAVIEREPSEGESAWQLLVSVLEPGEDMQQSKRKGGNLEISEHSRLERLLRQTGVPAGLIFNGRILRLISAPRGESSGWMDFDVAAMAQTPGRPIVAALRLLLSEQTLLAKPKNARLAALLAESRKYQNDVSEKLAEQVLHALYELLRGLQTAHDASHGELLKEPLERDPDQIYRALLTTILRLVFLLYAEERDMLPEDDTFIQHYSIASLHERLREDAGLHPDTMDQRFGAWAQLLVLFRLVYDGADAGNLRLPERHGELFDPDRFPFLEGRAANDDDTSSHVPLVPDGTVYRALEHLLVLEGERISYRALDVEQIGSVYETMMGFRVERAEGRSLAIRSAATHGAPTIIDVDALLATHAKGRTKWLNDQLDRTLPAGALKELREADSVTSAHDALDRVVDRRASPDVIPAGALVLKPSDERRRSGSHYTPRELTEPIVRTTLDPILTRLAGSDSRGVTPEQLLDLKVCDPAMGSGAFLVEACRQLGDTLIEAWAAHDQAPTIPDDEDEVIFARRLVAQRCIYGVDRNPVAVDLAKVSLWLITLAKEHPLTFLDHALRHGDSLVGLSRRQLQTFHWDDTANNLAGLEADRSIRKYQTLREHIRWPDESVSDADLRALWDDANDELKRVRLYGDLVIAAFFEADSVRAREAKRAAYAQDVLSGEVGQHAARLAAWRRDDARPLAPFHWEIEFPEVFERVKPGFDAFFGNPPFLSGMSLWSTFGGEYRAFLLRTHEGTGGKAVDLVAHFFRRVFTLLREGGTFGLIATNTIGQGDTREAGLAQIRREDGWIYACQKRLSWPGRAAVMASVVHVSKGELSTDPVLNGRPVSGINSYLAASSVEVNAKALKANSGKSFRGHVVLGMGFTFDDSGKRGAASSLADMRKLIAHNAENADRIQPCIGGEEVNTSPTHEPHRFIINFAEMSEADAAMWPDLLEIARTKVLPERARSSGYAVARRRSEKWWQFGTFASSLERSIRPLERCLALSQTSAHLSLAFQPTNRVFMHSLIVFPLDGHSAFVSLQSRPHELWARFFGSSMKDDLRYTPSDCFETFPFPENWESRPDLEIVGKAYYNFRAQVMIDNGEGLTRTYNRFHDPNETDPAIERLRELHHAMDVAVLHAYGWDDIEPSSEFLLDYEIDEDTWGRRRKPYRYRWPDDLHDEVFARLLELNKQRAAEEAQAG